VRVSETLTFTSITAGGEHTCALDIDGNTYCWGSNQRRQLGSAQVTETCGRGTFTCSSVLFAIDIEVCRRCGGKLQVIASIEEPAVIARILDHLGRDRESPDPANPSRAPPQADLLI